MTQNGFTDQHKKIGIFATRLVFILMVLYAITTILGFLSLESPENPIDDPYFTIMELLILCIAPLMVISMVSLHAYAKPELKAYSLTALIFTVLMAGITSSVHFVILTVSRSIESLGFLGARWLFSFRWPSVGYTADFLAWDWFFGLAMLFAAPVIAGGKVEKATRYLMIVSGVLSLAGLIGIPSANMQIRNIGVVGYALVAPIAFLLLGVVFKQARSLQK